jgi:diguanylate cyclase (GGDEF)-like protein
LRHISIDIDRFKEYNDTFGHPAGDEALKFVSACLLDNRRKADVVARIGGEEFAVILPETNLGGALDVANRIRISIANESRFKSQLTVSLGITELSETEDSLEALIQQADKALYEAKHTGRNRVSVYKDGI